MKIERASDLSTAILALPPEPFTASELLWSVDQAPPPLKPLSSSEMNRFTEGVGLLSPARQSHLTLVCPNHAGEPELIGSGVAFSCGGHYGILTARHVLYDGEHLRHTDDIVVASAPTRAREITRINGRSLGSCGIYSFLSSQFHPAPPPGVPDLALLALEGDRLPQLLAEDRKEHYTATEWLNIDDHQRAVVDVEDDDMTRGVWVLSACNGEQSTPGFIRADNIMLPVVDRAYKRGVFEYFGSFHDAIGAPRSDKRSFGGASGGGLWKQRLTERGKRKLHGTSSEPFTPEDLADPVLAGIAFYDMPHADPKQSSGRSYKREFYFHRLTEQIVSLVREVLKGEHLQSGTTRLVV